MRGIAFFKPDVLAMLLARADEVIE